MLSLLGHQVNRSIVVSLPELLGSSDPLICVLISYEDAGIWISSPELAKKLDLREPAGDTRPIFVPYPQVGFITSAQSLQSPPSGKHSASVPPHERPKSHKSNRKRR